MSIKKSSMTIAAKLWVLTGIQLVIILVLGISSYFNTHELVRQLQFVTDNEIPAIHNMGLADMMHDGIRGIVFNSILNSGSKDEKKIAEIREEMKEATQQIAEYTANIGKVHLTDKVEAALKPAVPAVDAYAKEAIEISEIALSGQAVKAMGRLPVFDEKFGALEKAFGDLGDLIQEGAHNADEVGAALGAKANFWSVTLIIFGIVSGMGFASWVIRGLSKSLNSVVNNLNQEASQVNQTASSVSTSSQSLSTSTQQQASALQETASSVDEITAMVKKTQESAEQLEQSARSSLQAANTGQESVKEMFHAVDQIGQSNSEILTQVEEGNRRITEIVQVINEIGAKTKVINDIVFQTKLLSFNASVEAARAGEHGKGFAVVAEEVGNLAQMSGTAAKEISDLLAGSTSRVEAIVNENKSRVQGTIESGKVILARGMDVSKKCGSALDEIVRLSNDVTTMISEITSAIREQTQGIQEISKAIGLLDQSTHANSDTAKTVSKTAVDLLEQATTLDGIVGELTALVAKQSQDHSRENTESPSYTQDESQNQRAA